MPLALPGWNLDDEFMKISPNWYGGRQSWLSEYGQIKKPLADRSCGLAALANVCLYLSRTKIGYDALFPHPVPDQETFTMVMLDIMQFVKPTIAGIVSLGMIGRGLQNYAKSKGVSLHLNNANWRWTQANVEQYIKSGMVYQSPVLLITWNTKIPDLNNHWVTITGIRKEDNGETTIITSNWGYKREYSLTEWVNRFSLYRGLYYFT